MRVTLALLLVACAMTLAQEATPPTTPPVATEPVAAPAPQRPVERVAVAPLAPPDLTSPYASPRDAARHRFQTAMMELAVRRDVKQGMREMADAFATDPTYAPAAYNLGLLCAVAGKWQESIAALSEAVRLDPAQFRSSVQPQMERLRLIVTLEATAEGQRARRYDQALDSVLQSWKRISPAEAAATLVQIGRIDPRRWEAPSLLAGLLGAGGNYEASLKFLEVASTNATDPATKAALQKAIAAAGRELKYGRARRDAEIAAENAEYDKAGQLYEAAWKVIPARADSGMLAASAFLVTDNTAGASAVLHRLKLSPDTEFSTSAAAMLKELEAIEPLAKASPSAENEFSRDPGPSEPVRIAELLPAIDRTRMELLARPLPRMVLDPGPVTLIEALAADRAPDALAPALPAVSPARTTGDRPWAEAQQLIAASRKVTSTTTEPVEQPRQSAEIGTTKVKRVVAVSTKPSGVALTVNDTAEPACFSPCDLSLSAGSYTIKASVAGYEPQSKEIRVTSANTDMELVLEPLRGRVLVDAPESALLEVNGQPLTARAPVELALLPGLYRIGAKIGDQQRDQIVNVRVDARLRLNFQ